MIAELNLKSVKYMMIHLW